MEQGGCLQPSSSLMCQQCRALQMQLDEQVALLTDANATLKKMKTNEKSLISELRNKDKLTQEVINECSALKIQVIFIL
jgi:undecaprenyl pyrophosphate synthase